MIQVGSGAGMPDGLGWIVGMGLVYPKTDWSSNNG